MNTNAFNVYIYTSSAWLGIQGLFLIAVPRIIVTLLLDDTRPPTDIETYLSRTTGLTNLTLSLLTLSLSGLLPISTTLTDPATGNDAIFDPRAPYSTSTLVMTTLYHGACAFHAYARFSKTNLAAFAVGFAGSAIVAAEGVWCSLFAGTYRGDVAGLGSDGAGGAADSERRMTGVSVGEVVAAKERAEEKKKGKDFSKGSDGDRDEKVE